MQASLRLRVLVPTLAFVLLAPLLFAHAPAEAGGKPIVIFPIDSKPYGKSYGDWSAEWWKWAYSVPVDQSPLFDETGAHAGSGQSGPVWFLAGVFNVTGTVTRSANVPSGKALFFPIINVEWDNLCPPQDPPLDEAALLAIVNENLDMVSELLCEVDGQSIPDVFAYRVTSDDFSVTFPDNNIFQLFGCSHVTPGTYPGFVSGGYYIMLPPLPTGAHNIHFRGSVGDPPFFTLDITYRLNVGNQPAGGGGPILASVRPNPLNPAAVLEYRTPKDGPVRISVYDVSGRLIRVLVNQPFLAAGRHDVEIDGRDGLGRKLASGIYVYRVEAAGALTSGRFTILK